MDGWAEVGCGVPHVSADDGRWTVVVLMVRVRHTVDVASKRAQREAHDRVSWRCQLRSLRR